MREFIQIAWDSDVLQLQPGEWTEGDYSFSVVRQEFKGALVIACWDRYKDSRRVTVALINGFAGTGNLLWDSLQIISQGDEMVTLHDGGPGGIRVAGTFARRKTWGEDFYEPTAEPAPCSPEWWHSELATKGYHGFRDGGYNTIEQVGDYTIGTPKVKGTTSFNGSHGGYRVGPYHFGPEGWQRAYSDGYRWAELEFLAELARTPLAYYEEHTLAPYQPEGPYWCGRSNVFLKGHEPDFTSLEELQTYQPHNADHMHRATAAPGMLAPRDVFARIVLVEHYWNDFCCWLDGDASDDALFQPLWQVIEGPGGEGWSRGGRGFAHAVGCFAMSIPYLSHKTRGSGGFGEKVQINTQGEHWMDFLREFIRHVVTPAGLVMNMAVDPQYGNPDSCRSREADLLYVPMRRLGGLELELINVRQTMQRGTHTSVPTAISAYESPWWGTNFRKYPHLADDLPPFRDGYYPLYDLIREDPTFLEAALVWKGNVGDPYDPAIQLVRPTMY